MYVGSLCSSKENVIIKFSEDRKILEYIILSEITQCQEEIKKERERERERQREREKHLISHLQNLDNNTCIYVNISTC